MIEETGLIVRILHQEGDNLVKKEEGLQMVAFLLVKITAGLPMMIGGNLHRQLVVVIRMKKAKVVEEAGEAAHRHRVDVGTHRQDPKEDEV